MPAERPLAARATDALLVLATLVALVLAGREVAADLALSRAQDRVSRRIPHFSDPASRTAFTDRSGREKAPCASFLGARPLVVLTIGQSNIANSALGEYVPGHRIGNFFEGACFVAANPLLGTSGERAAAVLDFADAALDAGLYDSALVIPLAVQGSSVWSWARHGDLRPVLASTLGRLREQGIVPNLVLYHQGEADCLVGMEGGRYAEGLENVLSDLRRMGVAAPVVVSQVSRFKELSCPDAEPGACSRLCPDIRQAQAGAIDPANGIFAGPDTDMAVPERFDGYHMTDAGRRRFAALLLETVRALPLAP
jgi:hypothetical protein